MSSSSPAPAETADDLPVVDSLAGLCELVADDAFVRFSRGPHVDREATSRDYESGLDLPGLSVNPLQPEDWWTRPLDEWLARQICNYVHIAEESDEDRRAWVLRGRVTSRGPDNEPLVDDYEPVAWLSDEVLRQAKHLYQERFDVSSDSTG